MVIVPNFSISLKPRVSTDFPWRTRSLFALLLRAQSGRAALPGAQTHVCLACAIVTER
jgi:hypothetical protein